LTKNGSLGLKVCVSDIAEVKKHLDSVSPTFCAAKWLQSTIWLNSGTTASCHLPPAHAVDRKRLARNPRELHNTREKIAARAQMLKGEKPSECAACWQAENVGEVSERLVKSRVHSVDEYKLLGGAPSDWQVNPTHLEIAFGNKCNFACTYCNGEFSSRWQAELKIPYKNLSTSGSETYTAGRTWPAHAQTEYLGALEKWWPRLRKDLQLLRFTGGEPLLSQEFWRFLENISLSEPHFTVAVNTNLGVSRHLLERLIELARRFPNFELYTSNEAVGKWSEYIRDGLDDLSWRENLFRCRDSGAFQRITVMSTLGALSGWGLAELIETIRGKSAQQTIELSFNLVRFPEFQSFSALVPAARIQLAEQYLKILSRRNVFAFTAIESSALERIVTLLYNVQDTPAEKQRLLQSDLQQFVRQYDERRGKSIIRVAPESLKFFLLQWEQGATKPGT
jgi:hypothetical protein